MIRTGLLYALLYVTALLCSFLFVLVVFWAMLFCFGAHEANGMTLTPISFSLPNQGDLLDEWTLEVDLDQETATWEIRLHSMALDGRILLPPTTADMIDGWGQTISNTRIMLPLCVTVMVPLGGSTTWRAQGRSSGQLVCQSMGTIQGGPFWRSDDAAAAWCTTGPGVRPWAGCTVFDEDSDGDVDLEDWSIRCSSNRAPSTQPRN